MGQNRIDILFGRCRGHLLLPDIVIMDLAVFTAPLKSFLRGTQADRLLTLSWHVPLAIFRDKCVLGCLQRLSGLTNNLRVESELVSCRFALEHGAYFGYLPASSFKRSTGYFEGSWR